MKGKILAWGLLIACMPLILSGCFASDMITSDQEKIQGDWYDSNSKGYFLFQDDGTYRSGYGLYSDNAGGSYELKKDTLCLIMTYTILDGQKQDVLTSDQKVIELKYRFDLSGNLVIRSENNTINFSRIDPQKSDVPEEQPEEAFQGLYQGVDDKVFYYFHGNGNVSRSTTSNDKTYNGTYTVSGYMISFNFEGESQTFTFNFDTENQLSLSNDTGQTTHYKKIN
jgi:hypothetical protein